MAVEKRKFVVVSVTLFALLLASFLWQFGVFLGTEHEPPQERDHSVEETTEKHDQGGE